MVFDHSLTPKKPKSRKISSRYLSTTSNRSILDTENNIVPKPRSSTDCNKLKSLENSGFMTKLWPSSSSTVDTFANHLGNERLKDIEDRKNCKKPMFLSKQKSCTEFSRFENEKEKRRSFFGGRYTYTGKLKFPGRFSTSSKLLEDYSDHIVPGRLSGDDNSLRQRSNSARIRSDMRHESDSEYSSEIGSNNSFDSPVIRRNLAPSYMAPTMSSRKAGIEVPSKYMQESSSKSSPRWSADSSVQKPVSSDTCPKLGLKFKNPIQRAASLNSKTSKWTLSPGRPNSPPVLIENKGTFMSNMKPPTSPSKGKKVGNFLSMGLELFKGKKFSASPLRPGMTESVHQLRMLHNRLLQWRYVNAKADKVNQNISKQAEANLVYAWDVLIKLRQSVVQNKLQLQRQKLDMKLSFILHAQIKLLEAWDSMERQHSSSVSKSIDGLQSAVCTVPLIEGATVEPQSAIIALQHASDVSSSIKLILSNFSSGAEKTAEILKEMAEVAVQEKLLLEEFLELFKNISALESQERSLKCSIMQLRLQQEQYCKKEKDMVSA
ncbi:qwrf motif-containing protein 3 [Nicotiana attenuata]|uniref:Qwrf motif-containing protein 3 n=2 Tax=Nicotiana attenuata TaxID=49451 RepID=A0A314KUU9_NICAT|nr:qwrf motif-containing protein 3 [Nicotiana attenuata]